MTKRNKIIIAFILLSFVFTITIYIINFIDFRNKISDVEADILTLMESEDDLYTIAELANKVLISPGDYVWKTDAYYIWIDGARDTRDLSNNEDFIVLIDYLAKHNIHEVYKLEGAVSISSGYVIKNMCCGFYRRKIVLTNSNFTQATIENYYKLPAVEEYKYKREIDKYGRVIWTYNNWVYKETDIAKQLKENIWFFEQVYNSNVLGIFSA